MMKSGRRRPFIKILTAFIVGVVAASLFELSLWPTIIITLILYILAFVFSDNLSRVAYTSVVVALSGALLTSLHRPADDLPKGERLLLSMVVDGVPLEGDGRWDRTTARVDYYGIDGAEDAEWIKSSQRLNIYADSSLNVELGDRLVVRGYVNPIESQSRSYLRLMRARGLSSNLYIPSEWHVVSRGESSGLSLSMLSARMQAKAIERVERLNIDSSSLSIAKAMGVGYKGSMASELKAAYARTGTAHLLAVSGLHTGFVLLILSIILYWLSIFRGGHIIKALLVVVGLWLFAFTAGLQPSVVRAALMLSVATLYLGLSGRVDRFNLWAAAAVIMLAINPMWLYDISFQLSFMAVLSILIFLPMLLRLASGRSMWVRYIWGAFSVGLAAQIGIVPLLCLNFESLPIIGLLITPLLMVPTFVVILSTLLWVVAPIGLLNGLFSWLIGSSARLQNFVVDWAAAESWASIDISFSERDLIIYYIVLTALVVAIDLYKNRREL